LVGGRPKILAAVFLCIACDKALFEDPRPLSAVPGLPEQAVGVSRSQGSLEGEEEAAGVAASSRDKKEFSADPVYCPDARYTTMVVGLGFRDLGFRYHCPNESLIRVRGKSSPRNATIALDIEILRH
jgi:hypothetical protein